MSNIPRRNSTFINIDGQTFDKVEEIAFKQGELMGNIGKFVNETKHEPNPFFDNEYEQDSGVYIYQDYNNPNIGYRIYKAFADYGFNGNADDRLIQKLMEQQEHIKLTEFPSGVVTLEGRIIGQQIPYYPDHISIGDYFISKKIDNVCDIYNRMLIILKELYDNGIIYFDTHSKNFMINPNNEQINLIDFDYYFMSFKGDRIDKLDVTLSNFARLINRLNQCQGIYDYVGNFEETTTFENTFDKIEEINRKIRKI